MATSPEKLPSPEYVLDFWFGELDAYGRADKLHQDRWWAKAPEFDAQIRMRFGALHAAAMRGELAQWLSSPRARLAYIVVLDQFSRNLYRESTAMFAADPLALSAALDGIERSMDKQLRLDERAMFYVPLMHSEELALQDRCVALLRALANEVTGSARASMLSRIGFAERHRDIVRKFGRFPHRNELLSRESTPDELDFLELPEASF
jgi:uncharacterized protein (DUF924 family)